MLMTTEYEHTIFITEHSDFQFLILLNYNESDHTSDYVS